MSEPLELTVACYRYLDRFRPLETGEVKPLGINLTFETLEISELFRRMAQKAEFDVAEMSASTYMTMLGKGDDRLIALPVFPSRAFRHNMVFVGRSSRVESPVDLAGKSVALHEYQMTAALWVRAFLMHDYGVMPSDIRWLCGGSESPVERYPHPVPDDVSIERVPPDHSLTDMFIEGKIDALLTFDPDRFRDPGMPVSRLFSEYQSVERDYFERTGFFPIMHLMVIKRALYEEHPWVAASLLRAFEDAKQIGINRLRDFNALAVMLPWLERDIEEIDSLFGADPFPYGIAPNAAILSAMAQFAYEQGLTERTLSVTELFAE